MSDPKPDTWNVLKRGSRGPDVKAWQDILVADGYSLDPFGPDADFGGLTERKTKLWQADHGLTADGVVGAQTRARIGCAEHADTLPPESAGGLIGLFNDHDIDVVDSRVTPRPYPFTPVGVMVHHTAAGGSQDTPSLSIIRNGRGNLPGPICQLLVGRLGTIHVCSEGHSNHAGPGRSVVLDKVRRGVPLAPEDVSWGVQDAASGNQYFYGIELENCGDGIEPFGVEQYESTLGVTRALMARHGWDQYHVIAHHEWSRRKIDPHRDTFNMQAFREAL